MFVMLICCVSAASATDVDNITVPDDTDVIEIDEAVDSVEEVEQTRGVDTCDGTNCNCEIETPTLPTRSNSITLTPSNYTSKFSNGYFTDKSVDEVIFVGNFESNNLYDVLNFDQAITITATGSTFNNIGFGLYHEGIVLNGATIIMNAPQYMDCFALDMAYATNAIVINNHINYTCGYDNAANYNYAIKAENSENVTIYRNEINANVPLKTVNWTKSGSIYADYVAGVAIENCNKMTFAKNNLTVIGDRRVGSFPTLDALIIAKSANAKIWKNDIYEADVVTATNQYSYIYGIDVYACDNITVCSNTVDMNGNKSGGQVGGNGTGAAYCIQLTGPHTGVKICNNNLTTKNHGPNLGIYSQNYNVTTNITVCGNHIDVTGKAGSDPWSLVSGMELQDTYATVYGNTIDVTNVDGYVSGACVYGISYSQSTPGTHTYNITNNTVRVPHGDYAVYLDDVVNSTVICNHLKAHGSHVGNNAVYMTGTNNSKSNNTNV